MCYAYKAEVKKGHVPNMVRVTADGYMSFTCVAGTAFPRLRFPSVKKDVEFATVLKIVCLNLYYSNDIQQFGSFVYFFIK